jgi:hypothetical protein
MPSCVFFIPEQVISTIPLCSLTTDDTEYTERKPKMTVDIFPCVQRVPWSFDLREHTLILRR